jgi:hypothetical protein
MSVLLSKRAAARWGWPGSVPVAQAGCVAKNNGLFFWAKRSHYLIENKPHQ